MQPIHKIKRAGLEVAMWQRPGQQGIMTNFGLSRSYKNKNDQWVNEHIYIRPTQILTVELLLKEMYVWFQNYQAQQRAQQAAQAPQQPAQPPVSGQQPVTPPANNPFADQGDGIPV